MTENRLPLISDGDDGSDLGRRDAIVRSVSILEVWGNGPVFLDNEKSSCGNYCVLGLIYQLLTLIFIS